MIWDEFLRHFRFCDEEDSGLSDEEQERKGPKNRPKHTRKRIHQAKKNFLEKFKSAQKFYALYSEEQAVNNPTRSANDICSFGLKGQALCHYTLDRKVEIIAVSPNDSVLYAIGNVIGQEESVYLFLYSL